ncbi:MAG: peptidylprolyl isomerase [Sphingomonas bacterium]|nr:peptidylprolyl isomerase [Sphingomonas bacterium]
MVPTDRAAKCGRRIAFAGAGLLAIATAASSLPAQTISDDSAPVVRLDLPKNPTIFGKLDPNVRKPTSIVNDAVITDTDVDQRVSLIVATNDLKLTPEEHDRLRLQVLRDLIDETLQIQQAKSNEITVSAEEIDQSFAGVAQQFGKSEAEMRSYLRSVGSSERSLRRQIESSLAWSHFLRRRVEPGINVSVEDVTSIIERTRAAAGTSDYHLKEIYFSAGPDRAQQVSATMLQMIEGIRKGDKPFEYYAQFSEATTRVTSGDLGWVSTAQLVYLPDALVGEAKKMKIGEIGGPIAVPGGFSILYLADKRQVMMADPRDALLTLKQISLRFPAGIAQAAAITKVSVLEKATRAMHGCGDVAKIDATLNGDVIDSASVKVRTLPPELQDMVLKMQVGEATPWFGSLAEGVRTLILCGRDDPPADTTPQPEQVQNREAQRLVNLRAQAVLRDLRRDAVIEYR